MGKIILPLPVLKKDFSLFEDGLGFQCKTDYRTVHLSYKTHHFTKNSHKNIFYFCDADHMFLILRVQSPHIIML